MNEQQRKRAQEVLRNSTEIEAAGKALALLQELIAEQPASVPDGRKMVPDEPTADMREAGHRAAWRSIPSLFDEGDAANVYRAMLAAAPAAPQQQPFGYFKAEPFGWVDCSEIDEGAIALYEAPTQPDPEIVRDAERLDWLLRKLPGDALRCCVGVLSDTSDEDAFREAIDAAIAAEKGGTQ